MNKAGTKFARRAMAIWMVTTLSLQVSVGQAPDEGLSRAKILFEKHDANGDQKLTRDELPKALGELFSRADGNGDGFITVQEVHAMGERRAGNWQPVPEGVTAYRNLEFARVGKRALLLDLYVPEEPTDELRPLIVWIHGGAWRAGSKRNCRALPFTTRGFVAASISYRLTQEATFPAQIHDCKAAIRWLRANAKNYRIDPERIGVWGSSAGGHLVALLGTSGDVPELEGDLGNQDQSSRVQAVCDFFGPTDFLRMDVDSLPGGEIIHDDPDSPESRLIGGPIQEHKQLAAAADPRTYASADDPPFLIVHGDQDPLVPWQQSKYLAESLRKHGARQVEFHKIAGAGHGFPGRPDIRKLVTNFFQVQFMTDREKPATAP